jgi:tRNA pseudouridine38-40 synthase
MRNLKLTIEYDGTNYCGWQRQANGASVQGVIEAVLQKLLKQKVSLIGAGRTDSGVHAKNQVANFRAHTTMTVRQVLCALNAALPEDIAIRSVEEMPQGFNARFDARGKLYRYDIVNDAIPVPLERRYAYQFRAPLNVPLMRHEAKALVGKYDFASFQARDRRKRPSISNIKDIAVRRAGTHIYIDITANGFLYNMVRTIVGTLIETGRGKLGRGDVKKILKARNRALAGPTAPAQGLTLMRVDY